MELDESKVSTDDDKRKKTFTTFQKFLKTNIQVKESLMRIAPTLQDDYNEESRIKYTDGLYSSLKDFEITFQLITDGFEFEDVVSKSIERFFSKKRENLAFGRYDSGIGNKAYDKNFSYMRPEFVELVKERCVGHTLPTSEKLANLIDRATTVNELLHVIHLYIMNDEEILQSMPKLGEKKNTAGEPITLYGEPSPVANMIFNNFPEDLDVGITDIVSMPNQVYMMVRDRGHALTIDMNTSSPEEIDVKYFVPKLCNEEMVRSLRGIDKSHITPNGARGTFSVRSEEICETLFEFIEQVPTDSDIPRYRDDELEVGVPQSGVNDDRIVASVMEEPPPLFSIDDAKKIAVDRRWARLQGISNSIKKIFEPLINMFKKPNDKDAR